MSLLIGSVTIGFILSLLALGVFLSFRIFAFPDITAEGSITLGASVAVVDFASASSYAELRSVPEGNLRGPTCAVARHGVDAAAVATAEGSDLD